MTGEEIKDKAVYFDSMFPNFFQNGWIVLKEHNEKEVDEELRNDHELYCTYEDALRKEWLSIICRFYPDCLKDISMEDLYLLHELVYMRCESYEYSIEDKSNDSESRESFENVVDFYGEDVIANRLLENEKNELYSDDSDRKWKFTRNESEDQLNFAINKSCGGEPCDIELIKKFYCYGEERISRYNINHDYTVKSAGLYQGIIHPDIDHQKRDNWIKDFVALTELVIRGKYSIDNQIINFDDLPWREDDHCNDIDIVLGEACSYQVCLIYYINYILNQNDDAFLMFVRIVYLTIKNVYEELNVDNSVFQKAAHEIIENIYKIVTLAFDDCKESNIHNLKMNCIPEYNNTGYLPGDMPRHLRQNLIHSYESLAPYVGKPTYKDDTCMYIAKTLISSGYDDRGYSNYISKWLNKKNEYDEHLVGYSKLYELGIIQELLYLLNDALCINKNIARMVPSIGRLCLQIQDYVYEDKGYDAIANELSEFSYKSIELNNSNYEKNIYQQFILLIKLELDENKSIDRLLQLKQEFTVRILNHGINNETEVVLEEINSKILSMIEDKVKQDSEYRQTEREVSNYLDGLISNANNKIKNYLGYNTSQYSASFALFKKALCTAEFLYKRYVSPYLGITDVSKVPDEIKCMDYSCIALEYYTALEHLANLLLYLPYREKILQPMYSTYTSGDKTYFFSGYIGDSRFEKYYDRTNNTIKTSLELGPLSFLYKEILDNNGVVKNKYVKIGQYLNNLSLDAIKAQDIGNKLFEVRELRNESAHGGNVLGINRARKAQDVTYIHNPNPDNACQINIADQCHKLIISILNWFI